MVSEPTKRMPRWARAASSTRSTPSAERSRRLTGGPPSEYSPMVPSLRMTRWQGTSRGTGLCPSADPTARTASRTTDLGGDPAVRADLADRDLHGLLPDRPLEVGVAPEIEGHSRPTIAAQPSLDRSAPAFRESGPGPERPSGHLRVVELERLGIAQEVHHGDSPTVPGHDDRACRRLDDVVRIGQADLHEGPWKEVCRGIGPEVAEGLFDRRQPGGLILVRPGGPRCPVHAVSSRRSWASQASRSRPRPRWTWAFRVPSGRSSASAISAKVRSST